MKCEMAVRAPPGQQLIVTFESLDIAPGYSGCADFLSLIDGDLQEQTPVPGVAKKLCGTEAPAPVITSGRAVTLRFDSNTIEEGQGFTAVITPFHQGECTRDEYRCDNDRCIDRRLMCDDHDNCGDGSDKCWLSVTAVVVIVIITIIVFAILVLVAVIYLYKDTLKKTL
ncbi:low-density lipoprotein receptor-related protein 12-like [Pomacea canaliculata]|uniref:low-density lipoprotein receptor-related protein 12-like n=1 Tax=Pomacea canaliculata TaxID=400727 RepID=UPI000D730C31|nr:low-density lipoprotein receptor-related protein 12-like [Pomacea canaliculata]